MAWQVVLRLWPCKVVPAVVLRLLLSCYPPKGGVTTTTTYPVVKLLKKQLRNNFNNL